MIYLPLFTSLISGLLGWFLGRLNTSKEDRKQEIKRLNRLLYNMLQLKMWVFVTKYSNVAIQEARFYIKRGRVNIDGYYFDQGYKRFTLVIEGNGVVIADYRPTVLSELPAQVRDHLAVIAGWE